MSRKLPRLLYADKKGRIFDAPGLALAGMSAGHPIRLSWEDLIPLPPGSDLFFMPGRSPVGFDEQTEAFVELDDLHAVTAFVAPAYTLRAHAAFRSRPEAEAVPLNAYAPVGFLEGKYYVPAFRVDPDIRQDCEWIDPVLMRKNLAEDEASHGKNQALAQMRKCAFEDGCPAARNYFHRRWEAPMPTSLTCNSRCVGCLSLQPPGVPPSPMNRLKKAPTAEEIAALIVPHLEKAERAVASFGQGCEGEPLTQAQLLAETLTLIRSRTSRGTLNLNTNASRPEAVRELCGAGLDSMRVSLNSARPALYEAYHRPKGFGFEEVRESVRIARGLNVFVSLNYFVFPGVSDQEEEILALLDFLRDTRPNFLQLRNLNMDPDRYLEVVGRPGKPGLGVDRLMETVHARFPAVRFGYFNPPKELWGRAGTAPPEHRKLSVTHEKNRRKPPSTTERFRDSGE